MFHTFQPKSNFAWAGVSFVLISLFAINSVLYGSNLLQSCVELLICFLFAIVAYVIWIRPKMVLHEDVIRVINPLKTELIAYEDIIALETKWTLTIIHNRGKTAVWVAPASGKRRWIADYTFNTYGKRVPLSKKSGEASGTMSGSLESISGQAAYLIRERMKRAH